MFAEEILPLDGKFNNNSVHVSSICELSDGRLVAAWYAGSWELAPDTSVYCSVYGTGGEKSWSEPRIIVNGITASRELKRYVRKVGNSVIWADGNDRLLLLYVSIGVGGWSASSLNLKSSIDGGQSWEPSVRLSLSPLCNISELVRNQPVPLKGGGFVVPIYHESIGKFAELLWLFPDSTRPGGFAFRKTRINDSLGFLQPSMVSRGPHSAIVFLRSMTTPKVGLSTSNDSGLSWQVPEYIELPNPDSGLCVIPLSGGRLLMVFNDSENNRGNLRMAVSDSSGKNWVRIATLEDTPGQEFSYPYMIRSRSGQYHIVYSVNRKQIKHLTINDSWIEAHIKDAGGPSPAE